MAGTKLVALVLDDAGSGSSCPEGRDCSACVAVAVFAFQSHPYRNVLIGGLTFPNQYVSVSSFPATAPEADSIASLGSICVPYI